MDIFEVKLIEVPDLFKVSIITGTSIIVNSDNTYNAIAYNGQTFVIPDTPWIDSDGTPMTSPATTPIVCSAPVGCDVENSDGTYDVHVNNGATLVIPDTIVKNTAGTTILTQPSATSTGVIADSVVTNSDASFSLNVPAETNPVLADITHIDSDLTPVVLPAMTPMVCTPAATPEGWYPPADWGWDAASALINDGDNGFVALFACFPDIQNFIGFQLSFIGTATVYWGDGTSDALTSASPITHEFVYSAIGGSITSDGCKMTVIRVVCTGSLSACYFPVYHPSEKTGQLSEWRALKIRTTSSSAIQFVPDPRLRHLRILDFGTVKILLSYAFYGLTGLRKLNYSFGGQVGNYRDVFSYCSLDGIDLNTQDLSGMTSLLQWFYYSLLTRGYALDISIPNVTDLQSTFTGCYLFSSIKLRNTANVTSIYWTCKANPTCKYFEMDDCAAITSANDAFSESALRGLILPGLTVGTNLSNCSLSATAINAFLTALGTANGAQTITVTGNPGAATCDTSIATAKGFTVVT